MELAASTAALGQGPPVRILVVEDDATTAAEIVRELAARGFHPDAVAGRQAGLATDPARLARRSVPPDRA